MQQRVGAGIQRATPTAPPAEAPPPRPFQQVHILVNPAAGHTGLQLPALNTVLHDLDIAWDLFVLRTGGEAAARTRQAVAAGVDALVVYGGDGTVGAVASALAGSTIPLVIVPGGTTNVLAGELGIPGEQTQAVRLLGGVPHAVRALDMGALVGTHPAGGAPGEVLFFHLGMGVEGAMHAAADREAKARAGMLAYLTAAVRTLAHPPTAHYRLTLDGTEIEVEGINCMVTSFGSVGVAGLTLSPAIDMSDGLLDVLMFPHATFASLLRAAANAVTTGTLAPPLHWQAKHITVVADPPQVVAVDGEVIPVEAITVRVVPHAVRVVVPAPSGGKP